MTMPGAYLFCRQKGRNFELRKLKTSEPATHEPVFKKTCSLTLGTLAHFRHLKLFLLTTRMRLIIYLHESVKADMGIFLRS